MPAASVKNSAAPFCQPWLPDQSWVRELAVSALKSSLEAMTIPPFSCMAVAGWTCRVWLGEGIQR